MEAFTYIWTDHKTNKFYVGSHKGTPDDGYVCSSKLMLEQYSVRPKDFTREIIATGSFLDMRNFEATLLDKLDAKRNPSMYNQHNGNGDFYLKGHTVISKKKIGDANRGNIRPDVVERNKLGQSEETKEKISKNHQDVSGKNNPMYGKTHSKMTVEKMSENRKGKGTKPKSEETKIKMALARKLYWERKKQGAK